MKIIIIALGRKNDSGVEANIKEFTRRVNRHFLVEWFFPTERKELGVEEDSLKALTKIEDSDYVVLLDDKGKELSSEELALFMDKRANEGGKRLVFVIGGAYGASGKLKARADFVWSLSKLTFPHQIARLIVSEQIYRSISIMRGEKYHHA